MVIVAVLIPPLMLGALLALARYEERMFGDSGVDRRTARKRGRHLHAVPKDAVPKDAVPKDAVPKDAVPKDAAPSPQPRLTSHPERAPAARHRRKSRFAA
ncbi:hypothetical protein ACFVYD_08010 [Streptomyces sp. NPDC058301]|uniref:hypothetical protein n=1 Tax=Streptomyces sp. NPDC058301 TaxID=3346436 RepID=UPI0036E4AA5F